MFGEELGKEMARLFLLAAALIFTAGACSVLLVQWLWPLAKAWIHGATG